MNAARKLKAGAENAPSPTGKGFINWGQAGLIALFMLMGILSPTLRAQQDKLISAEVVLRQRPGTEQPLIVEFQLTIPEGYHVYSGEDHFFDIRETETENLGPADVKMPPTEKIPDILQDTPGAMADVFSGDSVITIVRPATGEDGDPWSYEGHLRYQGCSEILCYPPETVPFAFNGIVGQTDNQESEDILPAEEGDPMAGQQSAPEQGWQALAERFNVIDSKAGYVPAGEFVEFLEHAKNAETTDDVSPFETLADATPWVAVLLILIGGFLLNLTPCVLPMIPINLAIIGAGAAASTRWKGFLLGALYGLSIAVVYGALGLLVVLTGSTFGSFNASPMFNLAIAVLFVVLGLAAMGVFNIDFSRFSSGLNTQKWHRGSYLLAMFMGGVSALLAGACVAPVVISVLLLSAEHYAENNVLGLLYPFLLGLGMGLPWPFAGAGIAFLPKPGAWMKYVRYVFGIFVFALAAYYAYIGIGLLRYDEENRAGTAEQATDGLAWFASLAPALQEAQQTGQMVFIDFWATWCKSCKTMEQKTFPDKRVRESLQDFVLLKYQAEDPAAPQTKEVLEYFGVRGLPTYVILEPKETNAEAHERRDR